MSVSSFSLALAVLIVLAFYARERNYTLTGTSLLVVGGALASWFLAATWIFG
jgi:hypothetical protein